MPGIWHTEMENLFPKHLQEIKFYSSGFNSDKCYSRRTDVLLSNKRCLEIQHSWISENEIINRFNDWNKFGKEIIWLIDGNTEDIILEKLSNGNMLIIFNKSWKYKSFIKKYKHILLNIDDMVFKIPLKKIKSKMIEIKNYKNINEVVNILKEKPDNFWDNWINDKLNIEKPKLYVHQKGAGNGKTYGIWKSICNNIDKKVFIIITKQHSAKTVIFQELIDQTNRGEYHIEQLTNKEEFNTNKHYVIKYTHKISNKHCIVIIGTIDSFCYNIGNTNISYSNNFFSSLLKNISNEGASKLTEYGFMKYAGQQIYLSKQTELWIDEVQDLNCDYLFAITKLIKQTNIDVNIVGDKLQSLEYEENFLTSITKEGLPNIDIIQHKPENINRRIKVTNMSEKINAIIDFNKYNLPEIQLESQNLLLNETPIITEEQPTIYSDDKDITKINNFVSSIVNEIDTIVNKNNYTPEKFLIIFPIMKNNVLANEIHTKLTEYWINKFRDKEFISKLDDNNYWKNYIHDEYTQYVHLHKHQEGTVINTNDSINTTRIMSIRSSKGDGREVVFILNCSESALKIVSKNEKNLLYESHLHVALTRAKKQIYLYYHKNNDDIHKRLGNNNLDVEYNPKIKKSMNIDKIIANFNKNNTDTLINLMKINNINPNTYLGNDKDIKLIKQVDWGYHCILYSVYNYMIIIKILMINKNNESFNNSHLRVVLDKIKQIDILKLITSEYYNFLKKYTYKNMPIFPFCILSNKLVYNNYCDEIINELKKIQMKINNDDLENLKTYEQILLFYMINLYMSGSNSQFSVNDLYNIHHYFKSITYEKEKELLNELIKINNIITEFIDNTDNTDKINWNIFKHIAYQSDTSNFKINKLQFPIIGFDKNKVYHLVMTSDISQLNFWDIMLNILMERFLIYNPRPNSKSNIDDYKRYKNKDILTYLIVLKKNKIIKIDWKWDKEITNDIKLQIKDSMFNEYNPFHESLFNYTKIVKTKKNEYWGNDKEYKNPYEYIINSINNKYNENNTYPEYILDFFKYLSDNCKKNKEFIKDLTNNKKLFIDKLDNKLNEDIDLYLGLNDDDNDDDDF